jgi:tripartite-type tricarboxylate transporter receptor subunit TctC
MMMKYFLQIGLLLTGLVCSAFAQDYPSRPVKVIVTYPPGGGADVTARIVGQRLSELWKQPVLIENKPGGGGNVGADFVYHAQADGYTLLLVSASQVGNAALLEKTTFDLVNDFAPIGLVSSSPIVIAVNNRVKANTFKEFIALLKSEAGKMDYASCGIATTHHFAMELLKYQTGTKAQHIPYKCASAVNDLLGNQLDVIAVTLPPALPFIQQGKMRALAVTSAKRSPNATSIPTVSESGMAELKDYAVENYYGLVAHAGTSKALMKKLEADVKAVSLDPVIQNKLAGAGLDTFYKTPEQTLSLLSSDIDFYKKMSKIANIKQE